MGASVSATVFRAHDSQRGEEVAVKILHNPSDSTSDLKREFRRAVGLAHPHVVFPLDLIEADGVTCYTMRLIDGADLFSAFAAGASIDPARLRTVVADLLSGLEAVHANGLTHGDIKPANLLYTRDQRLVLVDLGHARSANEVRETGVGTWIYAAPEVCLGGPADAASDWYSVGVVLFGAARWAIALHHRIACRHGRR